jgi:hypothetical protein
MTGPSKILSHSGQCISIVVQTAVMLLSYIVLPIQYHYRYSILKKFETVTKPSKILTVFSNKLPVCVFILSYIALAIIFGFTSGYIAHQAYCTFDNPSKFDYAHFWYKETPTPQLIVAPEVSLNCFGFVSCAKNLKIWSSEMLKKRGSYQNFIFMMDIRYFVSVLDGSKFVRSGYFSATKRRSICIIKLPGV